MKAFLFLCISFLAPAVAAEVPPVIRFESVSQPPEASPSDDVRITSDAYDRMTVPVRLAGAGPFQFLVDTGSDRTAVSRELAARLRLEGRPSAMLHSATGRSDVGMVLVPELTLSRKSVRQISAPLLDAGDMGADGILGINSLRAHRILFDFGAQSLSIVSASSPVTIEERDAIVVRARRREGRLVVTDAEAEGQRMSVVLDTGSELSVGNAALKRRLERVGAISRIGEIELISVTGEALRGELATVREITIGGVTLQGIAMVFAEAHTFRQLGLSKTPAALLGMNALRSFDKVSIDFESRKLRLIVPKSSARGGI